ncbi:MAG: transposase [Clostridia bacterium]
MKPDGNAKRQRSQKPLLFSHRLNELKKKANENLCSETGVKLRTQRVVEVEQTFGRIKGCWFQTISTSREGEGKNREGIAVNRS